MSREYRQIIQSIYNFLHSKKLDSGIVNPETLQDSYNSKNILFRFERYLETNVIRRRLFLLRNLNEIKTKLINGIIVLDNNISIDTISKFNISNLYYKWKYLNKIYLNSLKPDPLYIISKNNKEDAECIICTESLNSDESVVILDKCGHVYHKKCVDKWRLQSNTCPECRTNFFGKISRRKSRRKSQRKSQRKKRSR